MPDDFVMNLADDDQSLLFQVVVHYQQTLRQSPKALDYLHQRGITDEAIDQFRIGYSNQSLCTVLPRRQISVGRRIRARLAKLGIYRKLNYERFNSYLTFPIFDGQQIVDIYGHKFAKRRRKAVPCEIHLNDQRRGVWNLQALQSNSEIILLPSLLDALTFWCHGYRNVTCTFGDVTDDQLAAFRQFGIRRALVAAESIAPKLLAAGIEVSLLNWKTDKRPSQADALADILGNAEPLNATSVQSPIVELDLPPAIHPDDAAFDLDDIPMPVAPPTVNESSDVPIEPQAEILSHDEDEVTLQMGDRRYRVRGLSKNLSLDQLKINLLVTNEAGMYVDTFDLYSARHRRQFVAQAALELQIEANTVNKDLGRLLLNLEKLQDDQISRALVPKETMPTMTPAETATALELLRDPNLLDRIVADFDVVGETTNKLVGYLAAISRKLDQPLAIIIQSSSAAGKTSLMEAVLALVPPEDQVKYSAMTGQSLFYMGETNLKHKILAIVEEEGAQRASYALKLLQSEGELCIASTGKDVSTGRMVTQEYRVEGPVMIFLTTTAIKIDEELLNRCIVLSVDENREQTKAIHQLQRHRQTLAGLLAAQDREATVKLHRNAQRLLRPLLVANPYAESLTFLDDKTRTRRDHLKYLTLIRAIALLHQHQRPIQTIDHGNEQIEYIEVTLDDIAVANRLACDVLGRSVDELPPQTRRLLTLIDDMVRTACQQQCLDRGDYRFSRRDIREATGWGHTQLKVHLKRLEELEYLLVHRGGRGQSFVYELLYEPPPDAGQRFLARLIDVDKLRSGQNGHLSASGRGQVGPKSAVPIKNSIREAG